MLIILIIIVALILFGLYQYYETISKNKTANRIKKEAECRYYKTANNLENQRLLTDKKIKDLGVNKLKIIGDDISQFILLDSKYNKNKLKRIIKKRKSKNLDYVRPKISMKDFKSKSSIALELTTVGVTAVTAGVLSQVAVYSGVSALGISSTGTAISLLSGAAESNAVLAWLGGGSLVKGGLGVAGGSVILGGVSLASVFAVSGLMANCWADDHLKKAKELSVEVEQAVYEMKKLIKFLKNLETNVSIINELLIKYQEKYQEFLTEFEEITNSYIEAQEKSIINRIKKFFGLNIKVNFRKLPTEDKVKLDCGYRITQILLDLLNIPILNKDGDINLDATKAMQNAIDFYETTK